MSLPYPVHERSEWGARPAGPRTTQDAPREAFVHHTEDGDASKVVTFAQMCGQVRRIQAFHMDGRGWKDIGYHYMVFQPNEKHAHAVTFACRPVEYEPAAQLGHNNRTLAVAVYGNGDKDALDPNTRYVIECLIREFGPNVVRVGGHRDVTATDCPGEHFYAAVPRICDVLGVDRF